MIMLLIYYDNAEDVDLPQDYDQDDDDDDADI